MLTRGEPFLLEGNEGVWLGREAGKQVQEAIIARLEALTAQAILPIDFANVRAVNFSFADEAVAKIVKRLCAGDMAGRHIVLCRVGEGPQEDIVAALKDRECVCAHETAAKGVELLGAISRELRGTYELAVRQGRVTARDVIEQEHRAMSIAASSNRLARLKDMGLLAIVDSETVTTGGRQNVFAPVL